MNQIILSNDHVRIKLLGDSITAGGGSSDDRRGGPVFVSWQGQEIRRQTGRRCWASLLEKKLRQIDAGIRLDNKGISGATSATIRALLPYLIDPEDTHVLLMIGTNDRKNTNAGTQFQENLRAIIEHLMNEQKQVIMMTSIPATSFDQSLPNRKETMAAIVAIQRQGAGQYHLPLIDLHQKIQDYCTRNAVNYDDLMADSVYPYDLIHPPDRVHHLIATMIYEALIGRPGK